MNCIIQTAFLGDAVLTLPMLYEHFQKAPKEDLYLICTPQNKAVFERAKRGVLEQYSDKFFIHCFDKRGLHKGWALKDFVKELRVEVSELRWTYCVQRSFRSAFLAYALRSRERVGFSSGASSFLYTRLVRRTWDDGSHEIEKNFNLLRARWPDLKEFSRSSASSLLKNKNALSKEFSGVLLSLGSPWATKRWDKQQIQNCLRLFLREKRQIALIGDPSFSKLAEEISKDFSKDIHFKNFVGQTNVEEWMDLIQSSQGVISGDSAAVHIASDMGIPCLALFGPTVPEFGFAPWRPQKGQALGLELDCRPCHIHGSKQCPLRHHNCMKLLEAQDVKKAFDGLVGHP